MGYENLRINGFQAVVKHHITAGVRYKLTDRASP